MKSLPLIALVFLLAACGKEARLAPDIIARVGEEVLTNDDFSRAAQERGVGADEKSRRALLDELVADMRALVIARQRGYDRDPEVIQQQRALLIAKVREAEMPATQVALPSEQTIQGYYNQHSREFTVPARARAAIIRVKVPVKATDTHRAKQRAKIQAAYQAASSDPTAFASLAAQYSEDQETRYVGGDLGWLIQTAQDKDDPMLATLFALKPEHPVSEIIESGEGWFILKLLEHQPATLRPFQKARGEILSRLQKQQEHDRERAFAAKITAVPAEIRSDRLSNVKAPARSLAAHVPPSPLK